MRKFICGNSNACEEESSVKLNIISFFCFVAFFFLSIYVQFQMEIQNQKGATQTRIVINHTILRVSVLEARFRDTIMTKGFPLANL